MKYLVKTNDIGTLADADYNRIVYDATTGIVYCKGTNAYDYVDLGLPSNLKWAKCNIGANSEEEAGLYFQYGDTQGYTAEKVGNGEGLKPFDWGDYKFSIDGSSSNFSKYNASDSKTVLDPEDDAAHVNMGGNWRMPTFEEYKELCLNTDIYLVPTEGEEIQGTAQEQSGSVIINWASQAEGTLKGVKFYKKGDKQTYMFVPADGYAYEGSMQGVGQGGYLGSSSLYPYDIMSAYMSAYGFDFAAGGGGVHGGNRYVGNPVRGILSSNTENSKGIIIEGKTESDLLNAAGSTVTVQSILDQVPEPDLSPLQNAIGDNTYEGSNYLTKETNLTDAVVQLDEEIKATNDNLTLEHTNAEATYATKDEVTEAVGNIDLSNYVTLDSKQTINGRKTFSDQVNIKHTPSATNSNTALRIQKPESSGGFSVDLVRNESSTSSAVVTIINSINDITANNGGALRILNDLDSDLYAHGVRIGYKGIMISGDRASSDDQDMTLTNKSITITGKTTSDLLNAGGSTTSISDITTQVQAAIVDSAPETLDTLNELAAALGDDPNFATTVTNKIAAKQDKLVSGTNIKTINGQSLLGSGNISLLSNPVSGTLTVGGTPTNVPTINIKRDDTPYPAIILNEGGSGGLASITFQHAGTGELGTTINRNGVTIAGKSSSDLLTAAGSTTSLKTINNQSLLGSGNITIEGGSISQPKENIIVSLGDDSLTINGENPKTIEFFYNNRLVTGLDLNDYLPLSGGTLSGNLYMVGSTPQLQLIGIGGYLAFKDTENNVLAGVETMSDHSPVGGHGAYGTIYCRYTDDSSKSTLSPGNLSLTASGESIYVRPSGIEKNGGNNTTVFTTDGGTASLGNYATTASVSQAVSDATFNNGHNTVSSVAGIPVSKRLVIATISNNGSFTLASTPADGREIHVIVHNTNSSDIEITMPSGSNYVKMSGDTLTVAGNSYADINVISDGTNMYIRAL